MWTAQVLGIHRKPVALINVEDYWAPMLEMIDQIEQYGPYRYLLRSVAYC